MLEQLGAKVTFILWVFLLIFLYFKVAPMLNTWGKTFTIIDMIIVCGLMFYQDDKAFVIYFVCRFFGGILLPIMLKSISPGKMFMVRILPLVMYLLVYQLIYVLNSEHGLKYIIYRSS